MKKTALVLLTVLLLALAVFSCAAEEITSVSQLNARNVIVGVSQGSAAELAVRSQLPQAGMAYFTDNQTAYMAVAQGKIDAYAFDLNQMRIAIEQGVSGVHLLDATMDETVRVAVGISPASKIPDMKNKLNQFIAEMRQAGTLNDMYTRWVLKRDEALPQIALPDQPAAHLTVGTTGISPPYTYYAGDRLTGYDIELAYRFAAWLGADVQFKVYDYAGVVPAAMTGDVDCIMANLNITQERQEVLDLSDVLYEEKIGIMVRGEGRKPAWQAYNGKRLGVITGGLMEQIAHTYFPDSEYMYLESYPDCATALLAGRIDAYPADEPGLKAVHAEEPRIDYIRERITNQEYSFAFRKNDAKSAALCKELNAFLALANQDGTIAELDEIWFGTDEARKVVDMSGLTGENGTIRVVTTSSDMPFSYIKDGQNVGYDIDLVVRFCRYAGYKLELGDVSFAARIPAVQSGRYDFSTDMNVTEERKEQVLFSDPTSYGGVVLAVLNSEAEMAAQAKKITLDDLNGKRIGVVTGTISGRLAEKRLPDVQVHYFNAQTDCLASLQAGKIDAWGTDEPILRFMQIEYPQLEILDERLAESNLAAVFPKTEAGQALRDQFSEFLDKKWADGTMAEIDAIWFGADEAKRTVLDYESLPATNGTLLMAADLIQPPFTYMKDGRAVGYDIDVAARFCQEYGYGLEIQSMSFDGVLAAVQTGKCDFACSSITVTEERAESMLFSTPDYYGSIAVAVWNEKKADGAAMAELNEPNKADIPAGVYTALSQLADKKIGVQTGTSFDKSVAALFPNAQIEYYNSKPDMINALQTYKIEAYAVDEPVAKAQMQQNDKLTYIPEYIESFDFAYVFAKNEAGQALCDQFSEYLDAIRADGTMAEIEAKWFSEDESVKTLADYKAFPATNGTLNMATEAMYEPFSYVIGNEVVGYDIDIVVRFCQAYGYGLTITDMSFDAVLPAVQSGKCDFGGAGITITEERKESVLFSAPNFSGGTVMAVLKAQAQTAAAETEAPSGFSAFWEGIKSSFNKTFLRENRWKLFLEGVGNTMLITALAILFGTALGFALFMLCRNGAPVANGCTRFSMWLVQGTPMVVLLMILYYVIFGSVAISSIAVAVIGFTLTFGAAVFGMLKMGVGMIDQGQYEAAFALGHSNTRTFFKIILPQAIPHVLPAYQGEIVGLIKATAIVGYIAVQDLTKMGDIVRSRTYEAFFPLIAITVIYFVLEGLFSFLVSRIRISIDPKKRKRSKILKGVKEHD